jgi:multiple antibiotic resistance protein
MDPTSAFFTLLFVMDPLGNIPVFLSVLKDVDEKRRTAVICRELLVALLVMFCFLFFGSYFLSALNLTQPSVRIAGAIVLFLISLRMIFPQKGGIMGEEDFVGEPFVVPLAIPCVAGPSALAILMLMAHSEAASIWVWSATLLVAWLISSAILLMSPLLYRLLKERGLVAMERLMGMILVMISVQMFFDALAVFFNIQAS